MERLMPSSHKNRPLGPGAAAVLDAVVGSRIVPDAPSASPDLDVIVRHLCGTLPAQDASSVVAVLARNSDARSMARRVLTCIDELRAVPLEEVASRARAEGFEAEVARE